MENAITSSLLNRKQAAKYIGLCVATLDRLFDLPRVVVRGRVFFRPCDIDSYLEKNVTTKAEKKAVGR